MDLQSASRQIMWNVSDPLNTWFMYFFFALSAAICALGVFRHVELWLKGRPWKASTSFVTKNKNLATYAIFQKKVASLSYAGVIHILIYLGFIVLLFATTMVLIENDLKIPIYHGRFYLAVTLMSDVFGLGLMIGCLMAMHRRYIRRDDALHSTKSDSIMLWALLVLCAQGFVLEAIRITVTDDQWAPYSPVGFALASAFRVIPPSSLLIIHKINWWFHALTVFTVIALMPYSKFLHIIASSANLYFKRPKRPLGALASPGDLEKLMETADDSFVLGTGTIKDYSWKQLLDLDACTSCGRCQEVCPAYASGKPLSPKWLIVDSRNHALKLQHSDSFGESMLPPSLRKIDTVLNEKFFFPTLGIDDYKTLPRAQNPKVQNEAALAIGENVDHLMAGEVMAQDVFWSCTTCMACVQACPVGINHVEHIISNRQNMTMMRGELPREAQQTLRMLENQGNPYGDPETRSDWAKELQVKMLKPGDSVDYLYWVGCISAYDPRKQKIAQAMVRLMTAAGLNFGILGNIESCTGDPARRLGDENLFQTLAKKNVTTLSNYSFHVLVANCPHCFNTFKNEYPEFGLKAANAEQPAVIHHSQLLKELVEKGSLKISDEVKEHITFHDPCYLGRGNSEYDAPRTLIEISSKRKAREMDLNKEKGMCCGAGGGHFWMDLKIGERINTIRAEQAQETGASTVATACPFCMQMMEDGLKATQVPNTMQVKDIAELLAEAIFKV